MRNVARPASIGSLGQCGPESPEVLADAAHKTFRLTRNFAVLGGIVILTVAAILTAIHHKMAIGDLQSMAERNNVALARVLANAIWNPYSDFIAEAGSLETGALRSDPRIAELHKVVSARVEGLSVAKVKIYDLSGLTVYSSDWAQIGDDKSDNVGFLSARSGVVASQLAHRDTFDAFEGTISERDLFSSYIPIRGEGRGARIEGVFEVYYDVTEFLARVERRKALVALLVVSMLALIYVSLLYFVSRGDRIIKNQIRRNVRLAANAARAEAANQAKNTILANVSHELRTPLNAVIGFSEIIKAEMYGPIGNRKYAEYIGDIHTAAVHLLGVIGDIFDLTKAETGKLKMAAEPVDVNRAITVAVQMVAGQSKTDRVRLTAQIETGIGDLRGDERRLTQAIINLLSNAIKFTPAGGSVTVRGFEDAANGTVVAEVIDSGIGMSPEDVEVALSPFGQVDSTLGQEYDGTGLGLPLTVAFVQLMGGTLTIQSEPGAGTTIRIALPSASARSAPRDARAA